jgi:hypothetical protein
MTSARIARSERGNAFLFILIGIVLFAGLAYTISRSMRSETTSNMSKQQVSMSTADLMSYSESLARSVSRLRGKGISENDISFEATGVAANGNCGDDRCKLFHMSGGNLNWQNLPESLHLDPSVDQRWQFSGNHEIPGVGTDGGAITNSELIAFVEGLPQEVCAALNSKITGSATIPVLSTAIDPAAGEPFNGVFGTVDIAGPGIDGRSALCVQNGGGNEYIFYNVLIAR